MSRPGLFKDLNKRAGDLLSKEFPFEEKKFEWKGATVNNVTVEANFVQKPDGAVVGTLTPKYSYKPYGLNFLAEVNTKKEIKVETTVENQVVDGLKLTLTGEAKGADTFATLATEYKHEYATVTGSVDVGKAEGSTAKATTVFGAQGFSLGFSTEYFMGESAQIKNWETRVAYLSKEYDVNVFSRRVYGKTEKDNKNEVGASYFHNVNSDVVVGTEVVVDTAKADAKPKLTLGTQYKLNPDTILKGKFDTNGVLGVSWSQKFNNNSKLLVGANVDTNTLTAKSVGFTLTLSA